LLAVGVAGLVATAATRRVRELGIRAALGAERGQLVMMLVADHLRPLVVGLLVGLLVSWWTTRLIGAFLYAIDAREPFVWLSATFALLSVAIVAAWLPGRRAGRIDPMILLRSE
jgi:putative ABC transport system permease protein